MQNMIISPHDIIIRKPANELPQVWLSEQFLLNNLQGLSKTYLDVKARPVYKNSVTACYRKNTWLPDTGKSWRWAKVNGKFYYAYDNLPDKMPNNYLGQLPSRLKLIELSKEAEQQQEQTPVETFVTEFINNNYKSFYPSYGQCTKTQRENLSKAAAALTAAANFTKISGNATHVAQAVSSLLRREGYSYLPKHPRNFAKVLQEAIKGTPAETIVKLPRTGNQNASLHCDDEEVKAWITTMCDSGRNYSIAHINRKVEYMCKLCEKPVPSSRWVSDFASSYNIEYITAANKYGAKGRHGNAFRSSITLKNALYAGDCWQVDGTRVNFIDFKLNGNNVFLYIVAVRDVHSGDILGYSFDISENRWVVHNALKMAVETAGYLPYELQMDRFPGHNTEEMKSLFEDLENRGVKLTVAHVATGKAKLERWFSTLQQVFMMGSDFYYGEGVMSRNKFAHRSKEQLLQMKKAANADGWNFDAAVDEACKVVEAYRSTKLSTYSRRYHDVDNTPAGLHEASEKPNVKYVEPQQIVYLFGLRTQRKFMGEGLISIDINKYPFSFRCADPNVVSRHETVTVCYTLDDLSQVHIYAITDTVLKPYLGVAKESSVQMYGPDAEWGKLNEQKAIIKNLQEEKQKVLAMKLAVGSEFNLLLSGAIPKHEYEQNETMVLVNSFKETDTDNLDDFDIRNQY
jgi:hypothetical protein